MKNFMVNDVADEVAQYEYSNNRYYSPLSRYIYIYIYIYIKNSYNFLWFGNKNIKLNFHDQISMNELVQRQNSAKA